ncbi:tolB protein precursor, periplasmic protein involved in the tonb-independent uptake of group A colicins [Bathymodiolus heckerae thiotrophic gill symbiont]|uniref:Tol-Pal system beta propeller repeat protein TolB n=1 Tax=Bathymodiolus heckerae thiotrophic gill symbiont TaxID=1052212 RepID=UPI0010B7B189|nr:Tol-Pal system beta propeller repeat protein TolB [Bathymodiolus heckerae thiotrophic gill symbiont]SMN13439.1 tolB protein precursor, periplasmic protein involved in the tonb-independent uptake of group A colicins [Bathymodiolus heckerae thiotrophic gill symbiont]
MKLSRWLALFLTLGVGIAHGVLEITVVKKDENTFPVAISPFKLMGQGTQGKGIAKIIHDNLERSGRFDVIIADAPVDEVDVGYWKKQNIEALVTGSIEQESEEIYRLSVRLFDIYSNTNLFTRSTRVHINGFRKVAHQLSDHIYESLLGENGSFNTLLTYITVKEDAKGKKYYRLNISDSDAMNAKSRIKLSTPILSPVWSPDYRFKDKKIAYVSFQNERSEVFIWHPFVRKKIEKLPRFDGIASSPSWHPNGKSLVLTLSKNGNKDIYSYHLASKQLTRLTHHKAIDTEASYSADGKRLVFTSNRSGQVQIYIKNLTNNQINRITFTGRYNAKAVFSPNGEHLALVHRIDNDYRIAMLDIKTQELSMMSNGVLDESPYFSPNGDMIIFSAHRDGKGVLSVVSVKGSRSYELSSHDGEVREPNWSTNLE